MTVLEALPRTAEGQIEIPIGAKDVDGNTYPGVVSPEWLQDPGNPMAVFMSMDVPLSNVDYQSLLDASPPNWRLNWQRFREQGII